MAKENAVDNYSLLNEWTASEGDDVVAETVEGERAKIANGTIDGFIDKAAFLRQLRASRPKSA